MSTTGQHGSRFRTVPFRRRLVVFLSAITLGVLGATAAGAAIESVQQSSWGLANEGPSRVVDRFDSLGWAVEEAGGFVYAGGKFLEVTNGQQTESQAFLAAFGRDSGTWVSSIRPDVGGPVLALEPGPDGSLFVGGEMDEWDGETIGALAKIDPATGDLWPGFSTRVFGGTSVIRDLSLGPDGWMYAAGTFTTASFNGNPGAVSNVIRFNPTTGAIDWTWVPQTNGGALWGVSRSYTLDVVYISGWDNVKNGEQVVGLSSTNANQVVWDDFVLNFGCCDHMYDIQATPFGTVLAVGEQHGAYLYDESNNWNQIRGHVTSYDSRFQDSDVRRGGDYQDIEMSRDGRTLYASCHCWGSHSTGDGFTPQYAFDIAGSGGTPTGQVSATIAYDSITGFRDMSFDPYMAGDSGGWGVLEASDGCIWIAGGINAVGQPGSQTPGRDLARLCDENFNPPNELLPPASCVAQFNGNQISVSWPSADGAADYVISRSVNGGNPSWRGVDAASPFPDSNRNADLTYFVQSRAANRTKSDFRECTNEDGNPPPDDVTAPVNCTATINGGSIEVTWPSANGAAEYVIYRSVDGGNQFWRGRTSATSFTDSSRSGTLLYFVASKSASGDFSERTQCTTDGGGDGGVQPVASCNVDVVGNAATVSWNAAPGANASTEYVVFRSVDGGNQFWRGKVSGLSFDDTLRNGDITYYVEVREGNVRSDRRTCQPVV